jgi:hypothetical protein
MLSARNRNAFLVPIPPKHPGAPASSGARAGPHFAARQNVDYHVDQYPHIHVYYENHTNDD